MDMLFPAVHMWPTRSVTFTSIPTFILILGLSIPAERPLKHLLGMWAGEVVSKLVILDQNLLLIVSLSGRFNCAGTRLAKLQMKLVTSMLVLGFDISLVGQNGETLNSAPKPDWNDTLFARPKEIFYLRYKRCGQPL